MRTIVGKRAVVLPFNREYSQLKPRTPERVRFAPSPTGYLHLGGLRTALYNYLLARQTGGRFILRIEDTDRSRLVVDAVDSIRQTLTWTGLQFDEGPGREDSQFGPYIQSARVETYQKHIKHLVESGRAYRCYCSKERLEMLRDAEGVGRYDNRCRNLSSSEQHSLSGRPFVIRLCTPQVGHTLVQDLVFGKMAIANGTVDDVILLKSDGNPTYHFANVIDDHEMQISTVMRGQEWLPSTPLHVLLYQALGWEPPRFAHLPLLLRENGSKLSKRQGDAFVDYYQGAGYLPSAVLNFVALLGWAPHNNLEIMSLQDMTAQFDIKRLNKADAIVDTEKLKWFNRQHLLRASESIGDSDELRPLIGTLRSLLGTNGAALSNAYLAGCIKLLALRVTFLKDIVDSASYLFQRPAVSVDHWRSVPNRTALATLKDHLTCVQKWDALSLNNGLGQCAKRLDLTTARVMHLSRLAVTGCTMGASLVDTMVLLGRTECIERISECIESTSQCA